MNLDLVTSVGRELLVLALWLVAPVVIVNLVLGLLISIGQTVTGIQEQSISFAPRIVAVAATIIALLPWYLNHMRDYAIQMFQLMNQAAQ